VDEEVVLRDVVVGVDGSPGARTALGWGVRQAQLRGLAVRPVGAAGTLQQGTGDGASERPLAWPRLKAPTGSDPALTANYRV